MDSKSKIFRIKVKNTSISVSIDSSYIAENIYNKEFCDALNGKHYHAWREMFFVEDDEILLYCNDGENKFSNCILCIPPMFSGSFSWYNSENGVINCVAPNIKGVESEWM